MIRSRTALHRWLLATFMIVAAGLTGCSERNRVTAPVAPLPIAVSPDSAVRILERGWGERSTAMLDQLFTEDFRFMFSPDDSAGAAYQDEPWGRTYELIAAAHLFDGGGNHPPASVVTLVLDRPLSVGPDPRPGKDPGWHSSVWTRYRLTATTQGGSFDVQGEVRFFIVRGDSALLPDELTSRGVTPDSVCWYVERCEDLPLFVSNPMRRIAPGFQYRWGTLKHMYLGSPQAQAARSRRLAPPAPSPILPGRLDTPGLTGLPVQKGARRWA